MSARDLLLDGPLSVVPALLVLLLAVLLTAREARRHADPRGQQVATQRLVLAVRVVLPLTAVLLAVRLLALVP